MSIIKVFAKYFGQEPNIVWGSSNFMFIMKYVVKTFRGCEAFTVDF